MAEKRRSPVRPDRVQLSWSLADLPSTQHRAGLAGLVVFTQWLAASERLEGRGQEAIFRLTELAPGRVTLDLNRAGLVACYDALFAAAVGESAEGSKRKDRAGLVIEPLREDTVPVRNARGEPVTTAKGEPKTKTLYVYPQVIPRGAFAEALEPVGANGIWTKLWRDFVWNILRGVPATRDPFEARAEGRTPRDADEMWTLLADATDPTVDLPSTYYLGAQARNTEGVPFADRARRRFLLHFWPYVASIYLPLALDPEGSTRFDGYAVAVPDVADLQAFARAFPRQCLRRGTEAVFTRPREAFVDFAAEAGLAFVGAREGEREVAVLGVDVFHVAKEGNNVRVHETCRVAPDASRVDAYVRWRNVFWDALFRRRVMRNILDGAPLWHEFDRVLERVSFKTQGIGSSRFCRDAALLFAEAKQVSQEEPDRARERFAALVREVMRTYLTRRTTEKVGQTWEAAKEDDRTRARWSEAKRSLVKRAFLAVRQARCHGDFTRYFAETLVSRGVWLAEADYATLTDQLLDPKAYATLRTLTLLALAAEMSNYAPRTHPTEATPTADVPSTDVLPTDDPSAVPATA